MKSKEFPDSDAIEKYRADIYNYSSDRNGQEIKVVKNRLRKMREKRGLTQKELARRSGMAQTFIHKVEKHMANLTVANLIILARVFKCNMAEILDVDLPEAASETVRENELYKKRLQTVRQVLDGAFD